jgi:hypothetical protein
MFQSKKENQLYLGKIMLVFIPIKKHKIGFEKKIETTWNNSLQTTSIYECACLIITLHAAVLYFMLIFHTWTKS